VKTSSDHQIIDPFLEVGVAESNGSVTISQQFVVDLWPKTAQTGALSDGLRVAMHLQLPRFLFFF